MAITTDDMDDSTELGYHDRRHPPALPRRLVRVFLIEQTRRRSPSRQIERNMEEYDKRESNLRKIREGFPGQRAVILPRVVVSAWLDGDPLFDLIPSDVGYYPSAQWHFVDRPDGSQQLIIIFCVDGEGWGRVDGNPFRIRPGDALVVPPGAPHAYGADPVTPWTIYWMHLAGSKAGTLARLLETTPASALLFPGLDPALPMMFERILALLNRGYSSDILTAAAAETLQTAAHLIAGRHRQPGGEDNHDAKIKAIVDLMNRSLDRSLTIDELASRVNLSVSHFSFIFKTRTGFPVLDYFTRLKMQRACFLLDTTQLSVKEIAGLLGFDDPLYFSRRFRQIHSHSPTRYRAIRKG